MTDAYIIAAPKRLSKLISSWRVVCVLADFEKELLMGRLDIPNDENEASQGRFVALAALI